MNPLEDEFEKLRKFSVVNEIKQVTSLERCAFLREDVLNAKILSLLLRNSSIKPGSEIILAA
mgnify:CR=1 FL=1